MVHQALCIVEGDWNENTHDMATYVEEDRGDSRYEEDPFIDIDDVFGSRGVTSDSNVAGYEGRRVEVTRSGRMAQSVSYTK
jgi:hypothetical protein